MLRIFCIDNISFLSFNPKERTNDGFYLTPLRNPKGDCCMVFARFAWPQHKLASTVKRLCEAAGIKGFKTNHSLRATAATRLYEAKVDEQLICEKRYSFTFFELYYIYSLETRYSSCKGSVYMCRLFIIDSVLRELRQW